MAARITLTDLARQYRQNRNDIEALHVRIDETNTLVKRTNKKVDELDAKLTTLVDTLEKKVEARFADHDQRFDRLDGQMTEVLDILRKRAS